MSKSTNYKQKEQLATQKNVENIHNSNSTLLERQKIEGTPFTLIKDQDNWFMVMGDYRVTETTKTKEEQIKKLESEKWLLIMHIAIIAVQKIYAETIEHAKKITDLELDEQYLKENNINTENTYLGNDYEKPYRRNK